MVSVAQLRGYDQFLELAAERRSLGMFHEEPDQESAAEWHRSTSTNPAGENVWVVLRDGARIVAVGSMAPKWFMAEGERVLVGEVGAMYTAPEYRGRGYFSTVVNELVTTSRDRGLEALYATPNEQSGSVFLSRLHWLPVAQWTRWIRPTNVALRMPFDAASMLATRESKAKLRLEIAHPELENDDLDVARREHDHFERSPAQFGWRYPEGRYRMIRAYDSEGLVGWCVAGRTRRLGREAVAIADFGLGEDDGRVARALMSTAAGVFPAARLVFGGSFSNGHAATWRRVAAIGRRAAMPLIALDLTGSSRALFHTMTFDLGDADTV